MGEALVIKAIGGGGSGSGGAPTQGQFIANVDYLCTKTGNYQIICVGGGGGKSILNDTWEKNDNRWIELDGYGAGSGYFNWVTVHMNEGDVYKMTIGAGGIYSTNSAGNNGGTTSFGSLCYALGGQGGPYNTASSSTKWNDIGGAGGAYGCIDCTYESTSGTNYGYGQGGRLWTVHDSITGAFRVVGEHQVRVNSTINNIVGTGYNNVNTNTTHTYLYGTYLTYGTGGGSTVFEQGWNGVQGCIFVNYIN